MKAAQLIQFTDKGLYCLAGGFYIDPWTPVNKAVITHAHSDHAHFGSKHYLCHRFTKPLLEVRLGAGDYQSAEWNDVIEMNGIKVSLHPAGHIIGSSQIRVEHNGEVWVISGDYKTENDHISGIFEPLKCHVFITESTFGLPIYNWNPQQIIYENIQRWIKQNQAQQTTSVLIAYSLGKAQRLLQPLSEVAETIYVHGAIWNIHQALVSSGIHLPPVERITPETPKEKLKGSVVIASPGADNSAWMKRFVPYVTGVCSGWMQVRGNVRRRNADAGFALSDHADWNGLLNTIRATGADKVFVTHGFQSALSKYLNETGIEAGEIKTEFGLEDENVNFSELSSEEKKEIS